MRCYLQGQVFSFLTVEKECGRDKTGRILWECRCVCGKTRLVASSVLKGGNIKSCGCKNFTGEHRNRKHDSRWAYLMAKAANYKSMARLRGIQWGIELEKAARIMSLPCHYCGTPPKAVCKHPSSKKNHLVLRNGIDRANNKLGYIPDNVVPCCKTCNSAKSDLSEAEFEEWMNNLVKHRTQ